VNRYGPGGDFWASPVPAPVSEQLPDDSQDSSGGGVGCPVPILCPPEPPPPVPPGPLPGPGEPSFVKGLDGQGRLLSRTLKKFSRRARSFRLEAVFWYSWRDKAGGESICE
jgi:hypothetical protein